MASGISIEESQAGEITAGLRPNPDFSVVNDQFHIFGSPFQPFKNAQWTSTISQLFERRHKRELRVVSAKFATSIATTDRADLERQLVFSLRDAFNGILAAKSLVSLAEGNLAYWDQVIGVNRERLKAGDIAQVDLDRVMLQRAQYDSDLITAQVNLRTAKINLLAVMNERQPIDNFDVNGEFDFKETILLPEELHQTALDARPDLQSAASAIKKAEADNRLAWANGSTDPTAGLEYQRSGPLNTVGLSLGIPLRVFDRNQGEKARTALEIRRAGKLREALVTGIYRDLDSAYETVESTRRILRPYRDQYLPKAASVRENVSFAFRNGGATLLDFLDAQKAYRDTQLNYRNLIASYLSAVNQLNLAAGREVLR